MSENVMEASESDPTPCVTCGHVEDAHELGQCGEEGCDCTEFFAGVGTAEDEDPDGPVVPQA